MKDDKFEGACEYCGRRLRKVRWRACAYVGLGVVVLNPNDAVGPTCRKKLIKAGISKDSFKGV